MAEFPTFQGLVTLTLDRIILHTVMHHSSTSTYTPNFIEIEEKLFVDGRTDARTGGRTFETHFKYSYYDCRCFGLLSSVIQRGWVIDCLIKWAIDRFTGWLIDSKSQRTHTETVELFAVFWSSASLLQRETDSPPGQFPLGHSPYPARLGLELRVGLVGLGL